IQAIKKLLKEFPRDPELEGDLAQVQATVKREAEERLRALLDQDRGYKSAKQFTQAEQVLRTSIASGFDHPEIQSELKSIIQERDAAERAQRRDAGRSDALRLIEQRNFDAAIPVLKKLLKEFPRDPELENDLTQVQATVKRE